MTTDTQTEDRATDAVSSSPHIGHWWSRKRFGAAIIAATLAAGCGGSTERGQVLQFGQSLPSSGAMVQSFVVVETPDGEELTVWLPMDQAVWDSMRSAARRGGTYIEFEKDGDFWQYVGMTEPEASTPGWDGEVSGDSLPPLTPGGGDETFGLGAPTARGTSPSGSPTDIGGPRGSSSGVVFVTGWDPHSPRILPSA